MTKSKVLLILLLVLAGLTSPEILGTINGQLTSSIIFSRTPADYNNQTGYFTLGQQLTDYSGNGNICMSYDYFVFNAQAGQALQGTLESSNGRTIYYVVLTTIYQLPFFQSCGPGNSGAMQGIRGFNTPTTLNWVAPKDGIYALVFFVNGYYSGPIYFTQ